MRRIFHGVAFLAAVSVQPYGWGQAVPTTLVYSYSVPDGGYAANGSLTNFTDRVTGTWSVEYDPLDRIHVANASSGPYTSVSIDWEYDLFGNRLSQTPSGSPSVPVSNTWATWAHYDSNNRMISNQNSPAENSTLPDNGGNVIFDGQNSMAYDAENRVCAVAATDSLTSAVTITMYLYDAEGHRVAKGHPATNTGVLYCPAGAADFAPDTLYIVGQGGEQLSEMGADGTWRHSNVFADGQLIATYDQEGTSQLLHFDIADPLGTKRVQASPTGAVELTCLGLPFGNELSCSGPGQDATEHHFTGKERDPESRLDYFGARYYSSSMGRWISPDPAMESAILEVPQTWNRYSYVYNRPLYGTDPDGRCPPCVGALIGGIAGGLSEGVWNAGSQFLMNGEVDWKEVGANAAGGAVSGAIAGGIAGATGGLSLMGDAAIGAGANAVGGEVTRLIEGKETSADDIIEDAAAGYAGGTVGHIAADFIKIPPEPKVPNNLKSYLKMKRYNEKILRRNMTKGIQVGWGTASGTPPGHTINTTFSLFDLYLGKPQPIPVPPPPPAPCASTNTRDNFGTVGASGCQ